MATPWHENDEAWRRLRPVLFHGRRWAQAESDVLQMTALLGLGENLSILDMPCGPGRHALELARRGHRVTGVDRTQVYLDEAAKRAAEDGLDIEWVRGDMREFSRPDSFDLALSMYTSLGYFEDPADDRRVVETMRAALRSGGRLVVDLKGKESLAAGFQPRDWHELDDGVMLLEERTIGDSWRSIRTRWVLLGDGEPWETEFDLRLYGSGELTTLLEAAGFTDIALFGNLEGDPYDEHAERLIAIAAR